MSNQMFHGEIVVLWGWKLVVDSLTFDMPDFDVIILGMDFLSRY